MTTDQDLDVALALFNDGLARQNADRRATKAIENAEKTKQQAAAALKRLQGDTGASPEDRAAAEATYRDAVAAFNAIRNGEAPPASDEIADDATADDATADGDEVGAPAEAGADDDIEAADEATAEDQTAG